MVQGSGVHKPGRRLKFPAEFTDLILVDEEVWGQMRETSKKGA